LKLRQASKLRHLMNAWEWTSTLTVGSLSLLNWCTDALHIWRRCHLPLIRKLGARIALINLWSESSSSLFETNVVLSSRNIVGLGLDYLSRREIPALARYMVMMWTGRSGPWIWCFCGCMMIEEFRTFGGILVFDKDWKSKFEEPAPAGGWGPWSFVLKNDSGLSRGVKRVGWYSDQRDGWMMRQILQIEKLRPAFALFHVWEYLDAYQSNYSHVHAQILWGSEKLFYHFEMDVQPLVISITHQEERFESLVSHTLPKCIRNLPRSRCACSVRIRHRYLRVSMRHEMNLWGGRVLKLITWKLGLSRLFSSLVLLSSPSCQRHFSLSFIFYSKINMDNGKLAFKWT